MLALSGPRDVDLLTTGPTAHTGEARKLADLSGTHRRRFSHSAACSHATFFFSHTCFACHPTSIQPLAIPSLDETVLLSEKPNSLALIDIPLVSPSLPFTQASTHASTPGP